jgi:hypothetical protein
MHKLLYHVYYIHLKKKNIVIELIFPYSIAEGGGNCVPMYSNSSEIGKPNFIVVHKTKGMTWYD